MLVTNNPMVQKKYADKYNVVFLHNEPLLNVLKHTRDKIHLGHEMLTHPLSGSIKPNETPYKTILLNDTHEELDFFSLQLIEDSILTTEKLLSSKEVKGWSDSILLDFQLIDFDLIKNTL